MNDTFGYISDQPWQFTYHHSLSPSYIRFALALEGLEAPIIKNYCELAYGQGVAIVIHAACNQNIQWIGTDFNAEHVAFARSLLKDGQLTNLKLYDQPLDEFFRQSDLSALDIVAIVGTWSWLPPMAQSAVVEFLGQHLVDKGIFCLAHSTLPGGNGTVGLTRTFAALSAIEAASGNDLPTRIPVVLQKAVEYFDTNPAFADQHWHLRSLIKDLQSGEIAHLAHEYFNHNFRPSYFSDLAAFLRPAGLQWASLWTVTDTIEGLHMAPRQKAYLQGVNDRNCRQQLRDFTLNTSYRTDIWSKGALSGRDHLDLLEKFSFVLIRPTKSFDFKFNGGLGEIALARDLYGPLLEKFEKLEPLNARQLQAGLSGRYGIEDIYDALAILVDRRMVQVVNPSDAEIQQSMPSARKLNERILELACAGNGVGHLGSPLTGAGIKVSRLHQLFLLAQSNGLSQTQACARFAHTELANDQCQRSKRNEPEPSGPPDLVLIERDADAFISLYLPIYSQLQLIGPK